MTTDDSSASRTSRLRESSIKRGAHKRQIRMSEQNVVSAAVNGAPAKSDASAKSAKRHAKKLAKKGASKSKARVKSKHAHTREGARVALNIATGAPLKFVKLGAFGGRGARTSAIENFIVSRGARGASIRQIEDATKARAVAMHVRTLYTGARGAQYIGRKIDVNTGALTYFALKSAKKVKRVGASKSAAK